MLRSSFAAAVLALAVAGGGAVAGAQSLKSAKCDAASKLVPCAGRPAMRVDFGAPKPAVSVPASSAAKMPAGRHLGPIDLVDTGATVPASTSKHGIDCGMVKQAPAGATSSMPVHHGSPSVTFSMKEIVVPGCKL